MFANLNYVFVERSVFQSEVRSHGGIFEALHVQARIKEVRLRQKEEAKNMEERYQQLIKEERTSVISHGSKLILGGRKMPDFYDYNKEWQMNVHEKRQLRVRQALRDVSEIAEEKQNQLNRVDVENHRGPVKAWNEHFMKYIKSRTDAVCAQESGFFRPKIDKGSERIARRNGIDQQPVEERLLRYGELKKLERAKELKEKLQQLPKREQSRNNADIFEKLYFDGKKINKKKIDMRDPACTFQPALNTSTPYDKRAMETRKPLYYIKTEAEQEDQGKPQKKLNKEDFGKFLQRNSELLTKRRELVAKKPSRIDDGYASCTFRPEINEKSCLMVQQLRKQAAREAEVKQDLAAEVVLQQPPREILCEKSRKVSVPKIKTLNLLNFSAELLQTEDSLPRRTIDSQQNTHRLTERRHIQPDEGPLDCDLAHFQPSSRTHFVDEFDAIEKQLEDMLRQVV